MAAITATDKDYRFAVAVALVLLMAFLFGVVLFVGGTVELAIAAGVTPFVGLLSIIVNSYFKSKEPV